MTQSSTITGTPSSDCLVSYPGRIVGVTPLQRCSQHILPPQPTGPLDTCCESVLPLYRCAVTVFYSSSWLGKTYTEDNRIIEYILLPLMLFWKLKTWSAFTIMTQYIWYILKNIWETLVVIKRYSGVQTRSGWLSWEVGKVIHRYGKQSVRARNSIRVHWKGQL